MVEQLLQEKADVTGVPIKESHSGSRAFWNHMARGVVVCSAIWLVSA
jgi:hypothetical protein